MYIICFFLLCFWFFLCAPLGAIYWNFLIKLYRSDCMIESIFFLFVHILYMNMHCSVDCWSISTMILDENNRLVHEFVIIFLIILYWIWRRRLELHILLFIGSTAHEQCLCGEMKWENMANCQHVCETAISCRLPLR